MIGHIKKVKLVAAIFAAVLITGCAGLKTETEYFMSELPEPERSCWR